MATEQHQVCPVGAPISCTFTGDPASTDSVIAGTAKKPSASAKPVTAPEPFAVSDAAKPPSAPNINNTSTYSVPPRAGPMRNDRVQGRAVRTTARRARRPSLYA